MMNSLLGATGGLSVAWNAGPRCWIRYISDLSMFDHLNLNIWIFLGLFQLKHGQLTFLVLFQLKYGQLIFMPDVFDEFNNMRLQSLKCRAVYKRTYMRGLPEKHM